MENWVGGYLSHANLVGHPNVPDDPNIPDILIGLDRDGVKAWIDNYCSAHPLDQVSAAAGALEQELKNRHPRR
jgi:hypothetical protein